MTTFPPARDPPLIMSLATELYDRRKRGEDIFMGQVEFAGVGGFVALGLPANNLCKVRKSALGSQMALRWAILYSLLRWLL